MHMVMAATFASQDQVKRGISFCQQMLYQNKKGCERCSGIDMADTTALFLFTVSSLPMVSAVECFASVSNHVVHFICRPSELCCGSQCCPAVPGPFYRHWYFWLTVCMIMLVVAGFALSAWRHFQKQRKSRLLISQTKLDSGSQLLLDNRGINTGISQSGQCELSQSCVVHLTTLSTLHYSHSDRSPPPPYSQCDNSFSLLSLDQSDLSPPPPYSLDNSVMSRRYSEYSAPPPYNHCNTGLTPDDYDE